MSEQDNSAAIEAAATTARTEGMSAGAAEGRKAERERIAAIRGSDEAKKRPAAAESVAMNTDMNVEQAKAFLASLPEEGKVEATTPTAGAGAGRFDNAMANTGNPDLNANQETTEEQGNPTSGEAGANALLSAHRAATGRRPKKA